MRTFRVPWRASRRQLVENSVADKTDVVDLKKELPTCNIWLFCRRLLLFPRSRSAVFVGRATFSLTHRPFSARWLPVLSVTLV